MTLEELRKNIDEIDRMWPALLRRRLEITKQIAVLKKEKGLPILDKERERSHMEEIKQLAFSYQIDPDVVANMLLRIIHYCRQEMEKS